MGRVRSVLALAAAGTLAAALWWRKNPSACPYGQRFWVEAPHPFITRARLLEALEPQPGERLLEIGPGTGYYTFELAGSFDGGRVEIFVLLHEMPDQSLRAGYDSGVLRG